VALIVCRTPESTLIARIIGGTSKIADYPFTTLVRILAQCDWHAENQFNRGRDILWSDSRRAQSAGLGHTCP
jgi:GTPase involved in cell partitioning and DNA repair